MECANHACKCYRGALEQLVKVNSSYKGNGGLTLKMRKRLVSAARCAIRMRSKETDKTKALVSLRKDLVNGPLHCFGIHTHCSTDFCTQTVNTTTESQQSIADSINNNIDNRHQDDLAVAPIDDSLEGIASPTKITQINTLF